MIEILDENRISAAKIFKDLNEDEKFYLMQLIASEAPGLALRAISAAVEDNDKRLTAMQKLADGKYEVFI